MTVYVVTAFLAPAPDAVFLRSEWPWHVTVSTNFATEQSPEVLTGSLIESVHAVAPQPVSAGASAAFGTDGEIAVVLAEPEDAWRGLHDRIAQNLVRAGCKFTTPFIGDSYRAHVTTTNAGRWSGSTTVSSLHLVRLDEAAAQVQSVIPLRGPINPARS